MYSAIKKSISIIVDNPILTLSFVIYLIFLTLIMPKLFMGQNIILFILILTLLLVFTSAFFAGWLQMVKTAIINSKKENRNDEERIKEFGEIKNDFFAAIPVYILPLLGGIILYLVMFFLLVTFNIKFANHFIGSLDFLVEKINSIPQDSQGLHAFFASMPQDKILILWYWQILFLFTIGLFNFFMMFWASALYFPEKCTTNPLSALKNSLFAIFKHPVKSFALYMFILILGLIFRITSTLFATNVVFYFIFMILAIYFWVFVFVLIFDYYESRFYNHGDNGCNLLGKNKAGN